MSQTQSTETGCVQKLKILADSTRFTVLELLMEHPRHVGELSTILNVEQSLLSHHLRVLRQNGFVEAERDGKAVLYRLANQVRVSSGRAIDLGCCVLSFSSERLRNK